MKFFFSLLYNLTEEFIFHNYSFKRKYRQISKGFTSVYLIAYYGVRLTQVSLHYFYFAMANK